MVTGASHWLVTDTLVVKELATSLVDRVAENSRPHPDTHPSVGEEVGDSAAHFSDQSSMGGSVLQHRLDD